MELLLVRHLAEVVAAGSVIVISMMALRALQHDDHRRNTGSR